MPELFVFVYNCAVWLEFHLQLMNKRDHIGSKVMRNEKKICV